MGDRSTAKPLKFPMFSSSKRDGEHHQNVKAEIDTVKKTRKKKIPSVENVWMTVPELLVRKTAGIITMTEVGTGVEM